MNKPSYTYRILYYHIIEDLLQQICEAGINYCVRASINGDAAAIAIWKKFEEYKNLALKSMAGSRLDRHKLASCICGAIIKVRPLIGYHGAIIVKDANESLALYTGLSVIKDYMMHALTKELQDFPEKRSKAIQYLASSYEMRFPGVDENICDTQDYRTNLLYALYRTHSQCDKTKQECFGYDIWAYAKIFYHLEMYNQEPLHRFYQEYMERMGGI